MLIDVTLKHHLAGLFPAVKGVTPADQACSSFTPMADQPSLPAVIATSQTQQQAGRLRSSADSQNASTALSQLAGRLLVQVWAGESPPGAWSLGAAPRALR